MTTETQVKHFDKYICGILPGCGLYEFDNKSRCVNQHISYMLNRTSRIFRYNDLPDSIPERILELYLQTNGNVCFYRYDGELYVFTGGLGGEPSVYYMPTKYTIANPALKLSKTLTIDVDCVVIPNDTMYIGLLPMFSRYATAMTETELSLNIASINSRVLDFISAPDDRTKESAEKYLEDIYNGKRSVVAENAFLDGIRIRPSSVDTARTITDLIELEQYQKASWYNEIGLNANYNMKRESLNSSESQLNNDALLPLIDDMLIQRQKGLEKVNAMFGTNISVELASSWEDNQIEIDETQESISGTEPAAERSEPDDGTQTVE